MFFKQVTDVNRVKLPRQPPCASPIPHHVDTIENPAECSHMTDISSGQVRHMPMPSTGTVPCAAQELQGAGLNSFHAASCDCVWRWQLQVHLQHLKKIYQACWPDPHTCSPLACVQLVMRAMDRRARECEAASLLLAALHPKLIDPQQVGAPPLPTSTATLIIELPTLHVHFSATCWICSRSVIS
jgi:hypothetical protein